MDYKKIFEEGFNHFVRDYKNQEAMWDDRARELGIYARLDQDLPVMNLLDERMDLKGKKVLDVGFGSGKYLVPFKRRGAEVYGVEISSNMVKNARALIQDKEPGDYQLYQAAWEQIDLKEKGWEGYFDLVFVSKSPVMNGVDNLKKLIQASKDKVFLVTHITREDALKEKIQKELGWENPEDSKPGILFYLFNLLYLEGIYPDLKMVESCRENTDDGEIVYKKYYHKFKDRGATEEELKRLREFTKSLEVEGKISLPHKSLSACLFFDVKKRYPFL